MSHIQKIFEQRQNFQCFTPRHFDAYHRLTTPNPCTTTRQHFACDVVRSAEELSATERMAAQGMGNMQIATCWACRSGRRSKWWDRLRSFVSCVRTYTLCQQSGPHGTWVSVSLYLGHCAVAHLQAGLWTALESVAEHSRKHTTDRTPQHHLSTCPSPHKWESQSSKVPWCITFTVETNENGFFVFFARDCVANDRKHNFSK